MYLMKWPAEASSSRLIIVHGYAEHCGRYQHFARFLNKHGIDVQSYDQRGFGRSPGEPGRIEDFDLLVDDLDTVVRHYDDGRPFFPMAHSMVATLALHCLLRTPRLTPRGLNPSSPAVAIITALQTLIVNLALCLARVHPSLPTKPVDRAALRHDPGVKETVDQDECA